MIFIKKCDIDFDESILGDFEKRSGLKLPHEYVTFLKRYNGGRPESNNVELKGCELEACSVEAFFGVNLDTTNNIADNYELLKKRIPKECVPIADVSGGNIICINLSKGKNGYIYLWDHDVELLHGENITIDNMYLVAKSFIEFLNMIKKHNPKNSDLSGYKIISVEIMDTEFHKRVLEEQKKEREERENRGNSVRK